MSDTDPYLIPGTSVLRNKVNAHSERALADAENDWVTFRFLQLQTTPLTAEGTVSQLQWIHHYLFRDVYEWAGQIRTIDMSKGPGSVHPSPFWCQVVRTVTTRARSNSPDSTFG